MSKGPTDPEATRSLASDGDAGQTHRRRRSLPRRLWETINGLLTLFDVLGFVGFWLYRGTLKRTTSVFVALALAAFLTRSWDKVEITLKTAVTGTGLIFIISSLGGIALMLLSGSFSKSSLRLAEAKGANLLEQMKYDRKEHHARCLWRRVYRYEQNFADLDAREQEAATITMYRLDLEDLCDPERSKSMGTRRREAASRIMRDVGRTEVGWTLLFEYGMQVPMQRALLKDRLRYDLYKIKDWYDGAPFHFSDTKLAEHYDHAETLQEVKADARPGWWYHAVCRWHRYRQAMWFRVITRAVQMRVGRACQLLDRKYPGYPFGADLFFWPTPETDAVVERRAGQAAVDELRERREAVFHKVFHHDAELATALMQKAIYPNFQIATELRRRYDPEYVCGQLGDEWMVDVDGYRKAFRQSRRQRMKRQRFRRQRREIQGRLLAYLAKYPLRGRDGVCCLESFRALRVAFHTDEDGLRTAVLAGRDPDALAGTRWQRLLARLVPGRAAPTVAQIIERVTRERADYTRKLQILRLHHEMCRMELEDYEFYLERMLQVDI